jgi:hypothetical protein
MVSLVLPLMGMVGVAHAGPWHASYVPEEPLLMDGTNTSHEWTWDITTDGFTPGLDVVTGYDITLRFSDDAHDPWYAPLEFASFDQPGVLGDVLLFLVTDDPLSVGASIAGVLSLNTNGLLTVTLTRVLGDFYFLGGDLVAQGQVRVPEPSGFVLLGLGTLGAGLARTATLARRRKLAPLG